MTEQRCKCGHLKSWHRMDTFSCDGKTCGCVAFDPEPDAAPASEAQTPAVPRYRINCEGELEESSRFGILVTVEDHLAEIASLREKLAKYKNIADAVDGYTEYMDADELISAFIKEQERLREQLAQLRARVAILDAQEVALPELDDGLIALTKKDCDIDTQIRLLGSICSNRERQLLDALRAIQACREVARQQNQATVRAERKLRAYVGVCKGDKELTQTILPMLNDAIAAYDALAGKGGVMDDTKQATAEAELRIPDDLEELYVDANSFSPRLGDHETVDGIFVRLIERVARLEGVDR